MVCISRHRFRSSSNIYLFFMATNGEISINWFTLRRRAPTLSKTFASSTHICGMCGASHCSVAHLILLPFSIRFVWRCVVADGVGSPKFAKSISLASSFLSFFYECNRCALVRRFIVWCFRRHTPRVNCIASITGVRYVEWSGDRLLAVVIDCCLNVDVSKMHLQRKFCCGSVLFVRNRLP